MVRPYSAHSTLNGDSGRIYSQIFALLLYTSVTRPVADDWVPQIARFKDLLVGKDPRATEQCFHLMYRSAIDGRKDKTAQTMSAVDVALWDAKGKAAGEPVYRLFGGPCRTEIPAYASMLSCLIEPDDVRERAARLKTAATAFRSGSSDTEPTAGTRAWRPTKRSFASPVRLSATTTTCFRCLELL